MTLAEVTIADLEALRAPLTRYCYRLLGSAADTDDAVQETLIRAAAHADRYDPGLAALTTWVHRIATNVCLDLLRGASRRAVAMDLGPAATDSRRLGVPLPADRWVEPMPGHRLFGTTDPADLVLERETVRLAFVALLQRLPPRQRAVLVLRDVLAYSAHETGEILETTAAAVNSALQRARATLDAARQRPVDLADPDDPAHREVLHRYVAAFETHDVAALTALLHDDAVADMPPFAWWLQGGATIAAVMAGSDACAGDRLIPIDINGQPGFAQYRPGDDGTLRAFALVQIELLGRHVAHLTTFLGSAPRFAEFGLPEVLDR